VFITQRGILCGRSKYTGSAWVYISFSRDVG
jgi:hypothetical protein